MHRQSLPIPFALVAAMVLLAGCATPQRNVDASGAVRRTVPELMALRPTALNAALTSQAGERAVFDQEAATLRTVLALPPGPEADEKLPSALSAAAHFNIEKDLVRAHLLAVLPNAHEKSAGYQRAVLSAAHTQFWIEAAPLMRALLPRIKTPREFAIAAYTMLRNDDSLAQRHMLIALMQTQFSDWASEPRLRALERRLRVHRLTIWRSAHRSSICSRHRRVSTIQSCSVFSVVIASARGSRWCVARMVALCGTPTAVISTSRSSPWRERTCPAPSPTAIRRKVYLW